MHPFSAQRKHQKTEVFCFQGVEKGRIGIKWVKPGKSVRDYRSDASLMIVALENAFKFLEILLSWFF